MPNGWLSRFREMVKKHVFLGVFVYTIICVICAAFIYFFSVKALGFQLDRLYWIIIIFNYIAGIVSFFVIPKDRNNPE